MPDLRAAAAYIRVSTDDQMELSPDSQLDKIREYAAKNELLLLPQYIFHDDGVSGRAAEKRPGFQQMIATAKDPQHPFDVIIVWKYSRFARNQEESIFYKSILRSKCGVDVISVSEPLISGPFGSLIERIIEWMDEFYSVRLAEEVKRSMTVNAKNGRLQATPPFGYAAKDGVLQIIPEEAALVQEIYRRFVSGEAMYALARNMNARGIKTHRGNPFENRTVDYILNNPVYIGKLRWTPTGRTRRDFCNADSIIADAAHAPIVDQQTWDAAQERILKLKKAYHWHGKPASERKHWLCGIVRCPTCGSTLAWTNPHYMQCNGRLHSKCTTSQHIAAELLEEAFIQKLQFDFGHSGALKFTAEYISNPAAPSDLQKQRTRLISRVARLREAYLDGVESLDSYKQTRAKLERQLSDLDAQISKLRPDGAQNAVETLRAAIGEVLETLQSPTATIAQKHEAAQSIVQSCYFDKSKMLLSLSYKVTI